MSALPNWSFLLTPGRKDPQVPRHSSPKMAPVLSDTVRRDQLRPSTGGDRVHGRCLAITGREL